MPKPARDTLLLNLCAFAVGGLELSGGKLPERLVVCPWGTHDVGSRGKVIVNEKTVAAFAANQKLLGRDGRIHGDFEHNTVEGTEAYKADKEPRLVVTWGDARVEPGIGVTVSGLTYTPEGKAALEGGHYQDISPAVVRDKDGVVIGLHSFAFCRHGQISNFTIGAASAGAALKARLTALSASFPDSTDSETAPMKPTPELIALLALLGVTLAAEADEAAITTALKDATAKVEAAKKTPDAMSAEAKELTTKVDALSAEVKVIQGERDELKRAEIMRQAAAEGKVIPLSAEALKTISLAALEDIAKNVKPGEVPLQKTETGKDVKRGVEGFSADSKARLEAMGVSADDVAKYAPDCLPAVTTA
ncbi:MAG TPA: phage protease [Prosthecobacter sp.]